MPDRQKKFTTFKFVFILNIIVNLMTVMCICWLKLQDWNFNTQSGKYKKFLHLVNLG
jgi:hypothetical protein